MQEKLFSFNTPEFPEYALEVISFQGYQEIGELYSYEIDLISKNEDIDLDKILKSEVSLQIHNKGVKDTYIYGVLQSFEAHQKVDEFIHYKAYLVPKLWWLSLAEHQEIFLDKKIPDIIENILKDSRFTSSDYEFRLQESYEKREYVCQYKESRLDFIKRWMHRDGLYFYFESDENGCKVIITDSKDTQKKESEINEMLYKPASGLQSYEEQAVSSIVYRSNSTVQSVRMRNYNYEKPSLEINSSTDVSVDAYTESYLFGNNLKSQDEAKKLSEINAQRYKCLDKEMNGESNIVSLTVGHIYTLKDYFKKDLNGEYMMVRVESKGSQRGFLTTGFTQELDESSFYNNTFMMIPSQTQYRMQRTPLWPHIGGMISATIDGQGSGNTAELDKHGRYKVIMPFDLSGRENAKASTYLRMAQPSAGEKQGMHFPLHKGTEVLIAFKGGDPDQPVIMGAVPNVNTPSPVNEDNVTKSIIQTHGGNIIHMEDTPGQAHIRMAVHDNLSSITIHNLPDTPNLEIDPSSILEGVSDWWNNSTEGKYWCGINFETEGCMQTYVYGNTMEQRIGSVESWNMAAYFEATLGSKVDFLLGGEAKLTVGGSADIKLGGIFESAWPWVKAMTPEHDEIVANKNAISNIENVITTEGSEVIGDKFTAITDKVDVIEKHTIAINEVIDIADNSIRVDGDTKTLTDNVVSVENNNIKTINDSIMNINSSIENAESAIIKVASVLVKNELKLKESDISIENVKIQTINADLFAIS